MYPGLSAAKTRERLTRLKHRSRISLTLNPGYLLSIFEGAAEIQAHVIARRLLDGSN